MLASANGMFVSQIQAIAKGLVSCAWIAATFAWVFVRWPLGFFAVLKVGRVVVSGAQAPIQAWLDAIGYALAFILIRWFVRSYRP